MFYKKYTKDHVVDVVKPGSWENYGLLIQKQGHSPLNRPISYRPRPRGHRTFATIFEAADYIKHACDHSRDTRGYIIRVFPGVYVENFVNIPINTIVEGQISNNDKTSVVVLSRNTIHTQDSNIRSIYFLNN